nr:MAG TPA: hypothetical protein [Caudoviricetes sp.]
MLEIPCVHSISLIRTFVKRQIHKNNIYEQIYILCITFGADFYLR